MAVRYCQRCTKNVVTKLFRSNCGQCGTITKPVDNTLAIPEDRSKHDTYVKRRQYR